MKKLTTILSNLLQRLFGKKNKFEEYVHTAGVTQEKTTAPFEPETNVLTGIPLPEAFLGDNYGPNIGWLHKDDLFVNFQVVGMMAMDDADFFIRYIGAHDGHAQQSLTPEERLEYPQHFYPCFADMAEVVKTHMRQNLQTLNDDQDAWIVAYGNTMGLILVTAADSVDIKRRSIGFEDETTSLHYQMQFMRFDPKAIERFGIAGGVFDEFLASQVHYPPLQVNFAKYNEEV